MHIWHDKTGWHFELRVELYADTLKYFALLVFVLLLMLILVLGTK